MRDFFREWGGAFARAWSKMIRLPLPLKLEQLAIEYGSSREAAAFVLAGWFSGVLIALLAVITAWCFNLLGGAVLFAVCMWLLLLWHDAGRGDGKIASIISGALPGDGGNFQVALPVFMMVMKFVLLMGVFYCGGGGFTALVIGGCFALEAQLLGALDVTPALLDFSPKALLRFRIVLGIVLIIGFLCAGIAAALSAMIFAMLCKSGSEKMLRIGIGSDDVRAYSSLFVWLSLICRLIVS